MFLYAHIRTYNSHSITINSLETSYDAYSTLLSTFTESGNLTVKSCKDELHKWFICYFMLTCFQQRLCSLYLLKKKLSSAQAVFTTKRQFQNFKFCIEDKQNQENFVLNIFEGFATCIMQTFRQIAGKVSCRSYGVNRLPPFNDLHFFFCGTFTDISKAAICNLVTTGGGIVHKNINDLLRKKANCQNCFIIASCRNFILEIYTRYRIVTLDVSYIYRCIARYKLLSIKPYILMNRRDKNYTKENNMKMLDGKTIK
ncbi:hypothetical protein T06_16318 [Trichinella sp. T6]|nr:hypothetical protein T06_16318 [Trichinella sp. T6]